MSKALNKLAAKHPDKIEGWYRDQDGYWIDLRYGWCREKFDYVHGIHEDTVKECLEAFKSVAVCQCDQCK